MKRLISIWLCAAIIMSPAFFLASVDGAFISQNVIAYISHPPILISGDGDFGIGINGVTAGDGSMGNPWIIEGWEIDGTGIQYCIKIENTLDYFIIKNCSLNNTNIPSGSGLYLDNVHQGDINNNTFNSNWNGVWFYNSELLSIENNTIIDSYKEGIYLEQSHNNTVQYNYASFNGYNGICLSSSDDNIVSHNIASSNLAFHGINLAVSNHNIVNNNTCNSNDDNGIDLNLADNNSICNNTCVSNNDNGIETRYSDNNTISDNIISDGFKGIYLSYSDWTTIDNNTIENNGYGFDSISSNNITVQDNVISQHGNRGIGHSSAYHLIAKNNTLSDNDNAIILSDSFFSIIEGNVLHDNIDGMVITTENLTISNNTISRDDDGILISASNNIQIYNNTINQMVESIEVTSSSNITIDYNEIRDGFYGLRMFWSPDNQVSNNSITNLSYEGIYLSDCDNSSILSNRISLTEVGIVSYDFSDYCRYISNNVSNNIYHGIVLGRSHNCVIERNMAYMNGENATKMFESENNTISNNTFANNKYGLSLYICLNNQINHNTFTNNTVQAYDTGTNNWDNGYPIGGNYWSDYGGYDLYSGPNQNETGHDGIGDVGYGISGGSMIDGYPIVGLHNAHSPIRINSNTDFDAEHGVINWAIANGTYENPWIIQGLDIDGGGHGYCIYVGNTTEHFVIRGCTLFNASGNSGLLYNNSGIFLNNVKNGSITNNTCHDNENGIAMETSSNQTIQNNSCHDNSYSGFRIFNIWDSEFSQNMLFNNSYGLLVEDDVKQLTHNDIDDINPIINNQGKVVWQGDTGTYDYDLFYYNGTVQQLTSTPGSESGYDINQRGEIVWDYGNIYHWFNGTQTTITTNPNDDRSPDINEFGNITYEAHDGNDYEIAYWNGSVNILTDNTYHDRDPKMNNHEQITWWGEEDVLLSNVYYWDGAVTAITNNPLADWSEYPVINDNGIIIYAGRDGGMYNDMFYWDGTSTQLTDNNWDNYGFCLNENNEIAWLIFDNGFPDTYYANFWNGTSHELRNAGSSYINIDMNEKGEVVWYEGTSSSSKYYFWNGTIHEVGNYTGPSYKVKINDKSHMVWSSKIDGDYEIFYYDFNKTHGNDFVGNHIQDNDIGARFISGENNLLYHNNFVNNTIQAIDNGTNTWDNGYPSGGNYWSDYVGNDTFSGPLQNIPGRDNIGDLPYVIDMNSNDTYPLMNAFNDWCEVPPTIELISPANNSIFPPGTVIDFEIWDANLNLNNANYSINAAVDQSFAIDYQIDTTGWPEGNYTIQVNAIDTTDLGTSTTYTFVVDIGPPEITLLSPSNNSYIVAGSVIDLDISDTTTVTVNYSVNGGAVISLSNPYDINTTPWLDGPKEIVVNAIDETGQTNTSIFNFIMDSEKPSITLLSPVNNSVITPGTILDFLITDANLNITNVSINSGPYSPLNSPFDINTNAWADGNYTVEINANDPANNERYEMYHFTIDSILPTILLNSPTNNTIISPGTIIDVDVSDINLNSVEYSINGGLNQIFPMPYDLDTSGWSDGTYSIQITANDDAGHTEVAIFEFMIDTTSPNVNVGFTYYTNSTFTRDATTSDTTSGISSYLWSKESGPGNIVFGSPNSEDTTITADTDGVYSIRLTVTDNAGNSNYDEFDLYWDTAPPVVDAGVNITANAEFIQNATAYDETSPIMIIQWSQQSGPGTVEIYDSWRIDNNFSADIDGTYILRLTVTDIIGQRSYDEFTLIWDATKPDIDAGSNVSSSTQFLQNALAFDNQTGIQNIQWTQESGPGTITFGTPTAEDTTIEADIDGIYIILLNVTDNAGNWAYDEFTLIWDTTAPIITLTSPVNFTVLPPITLDFDIVEPNLLNASYSVDGGEFYNLYSPNFFIEFGLDSGTFMFEIYANDTAGNEAREWFNLTFDNDDPFFLITTPMTFGKIQSGTDIDVDIVEEHLLTANYSVNGATPVTFSPIHSINTTGWTEGDYYIIFSAIDEAGNSRILNFTFAIDNSAPIIVATSPADGAENVTISTNQIIIEFDEMVNTSSVEDAISISPTIGISGMSWFNYTELTIILSENLSYNHNYMITIGVGASDQIGNSLLSPISFGFSTPIDTDNDDIPDSVDSDDDGDGTLDEDDDFPLDPNEDTDTDNDGIGDNADTDDDGDGVIDSDDAFPLDEQESIDTDGDGIGNNADTDDDGDGVPDDIDEDPLDPEVGEANDDGPGGGSNYLWVIIILVVVGVVGAALFLRMRSKPEIPEEAPEAEENLE